MFEFRCFIAQLLLQDMKTMAFGCILAYMTVFTVVEINAKRIVQLKISSARKPRQIVH